MTTSIDFAVGKLCVVCGLCCNGALFKDVQLQAGDDAAQLQALGLPLAGRGRRFPQPCAALEDCRCRIYVDRPSRCRDFECALLKAVGAGRVKTAVALRTIRRARQRVERVQGLLRQLGDTDEETALSVRFRRTVKRMEANAPDEMAAEVFARLTLAMHDLNVILSREFYPGTGG